MKFAHAGARRDGCTMRTLFAPRARDFSLTARNAARRVSFFL
jgi:hypothetical protein